MSERAVFRTRLLDETTSTNDEVKHALDAGEAEGLVVRARRQTGGYGRQGRSWASPDGGLYVSFLLRPLVDASVLPTLSLVAALAVRKAIVGHLPERERGRVCVKWPNDIVYLRPADNAPRQCGASTPSCDAAHEGPSVPGRCGMSSFRKLSGILLETHAKGVCLGMGVNVFPPASAERVGGKNVPQYLTELMGRDRLAARSDGLLDHLLAAVLAEFAPLYARWQSDGFAPFTAVYREHAALTGRFVHVVDRSGSPVAEGSVDDVDRRGRLVLRAADGSPSFVQSGEIHLI